MPPSRPSGTRLHQHTQNHEASRSLSCRDPPLHVAEASHNTSSALSKMEEGQCSRTTPRNEVRASLVPADPRYLQVDITKQETEIHSQVTCSSSQERDCCVVSRDDAKGDFVEIKNTGTSAIVVDDAIVDKEESIEIKSGSKMMLKVSFEADQLKCSICLNIWHDVVTTAPCFHNFCNGCFSEWLKTCEERHQAALCPQCRASILSVGRNHFLRDIEVSILLENPALRRSDEELVLLDRRAYIKSNLVLGSRKTSSRKRPSPFSSPRLDFFDIQCPQCATEIGGFRCSQNTAHLQCHACGGMMPSRPDCSVPQICLGCDGAFCGAYWLRQDRNIDNTLTICTAETFKPITERRVLQIPDCAHQHNHYEKSVTERCIQFTGKTLEIIISEQISLFNNRELDRTRMPLKHAETISSQTHLCDHCYQKFISYLLYWFRTTLPSSRLPPEVADRQNCWYGYACRTQRHNDDHARKRNHVCRPTRGDINAPLPS